MAKAFMMKQKNQKSKLLHYIPDFVMKTFCGKYIDEGKNSWEYCQDVLM